MEILASGYGLIEGPRVDGEGKLYFSDVHNGGVYRLAPDGAIETGAPEGAIETVLPKRRGVGGIALHAQGGVVISGRNICRVHEGETTVYFERPEGVGGFNDLFADAAGRIYVGSLRSDPFAPDDESRVAGECYRIDLDGTVTEIYGDVGLSNGIGISPDGRRLYHADTNATGIIVHELTPDGEVSNRRVFATLERGRPDGLAVDADGGVWVASYGGGAVLRYTPEGAFDRAVDVPAIAVTSLCFAGPDLRDLIIVTADNTAGAKPGGAIFRTDGGVSGLPAASVRVDPA